MQAGIGDAVRRKEDLRLVTGRGCYSDDFNFPGQAYAADGALAACPRAHPLDRCSGGARHAGRACGADRRRMRAPTGSSAIPHLAAPGTPPDIVLHNRDGSPVPVAPHHVAADRPRAPCRRRRSRSSIAETICAAKDAAEQVVVDYEALPAVTRRMAARAPGRAAALRRHCRTS